jgi:hypothetical protein
MEAARQLNIQSLQAWPMGGPSFKQLSAMTKTESYRQNVSALGIVKETDVHGFSEESAFQSACDLLSKVGEPVPTEPSAIAEQRSAVLIVHGCFESMFLSAVSDDLAIDCIRRYFECTKAKGLPAPASASKAEWQAFLSSRATFVASTRVAMQQGHLSLEHPAFADLVRFLKALADSA